jgi:hypothetical protein
LPRPWWGELRLAVFTIRFSVAEALFKKQFSDGLLDVVIVADEADRQLEETVVGFMEARAAA